MLAIIKDGVEKFLTSSNDEIKFSSDIDKELLLKELYDYNSITYPIDAPTILDCLQQLGLVAIVQEKSKIVYRVPNLTPKPKRVFRFPKDWHKRMDEYVEKGTILFSYLSLDEIV